MRRSGSGGFTLLEVLVALTIVSVAIVSLIELAAQGMRLLKLSGDHQRAVEIADRIARETAASEESVEAGEEGSFTWERRVSLVPLPEELVPARSSADPTPLFAVSVAVRWGRQSVEVATLKSPPPAPPPTAPQTGEPPAQGERPGAAGRPGTTPTRPPGTGGRS